MKNRIKEEKKGAPQFGQLITEIVPAPTVFGVRKGKGPSTQKPPTVPSRNKIFRPAERRRGDSARAPRPREKGKCREEAFFMSKRGQKVNEDTHSPFPPKTSETRHVGGKTQREREKRWILSSMPAGNW